MYTYVIYLMNRKVHVFSHILIEISLLTCCSSNPDIILLMFTRRTGPTRSQR